MDRSVEAVRDEQDLIDAVAAAAADSEPLLIEGAGTRSRVGVWSAPPPRRLDLSAFAGVLDYEPTELVLTAGAMTSLDEIETLLSSKNQMLAFEPPRHGHLTGDTNASPTLGGVIGANAAGPRRLTAGAARDHFLGFRAVSGRGEAFKAGGKVVKNVTGFDLPKVMAGSWGTLAVMTEISIKVLPRPETVTTLVISGLDPAAALAASAAALSSPAQVSSAAYLPSAAAIQVLSGAFSHSLTLLRLEGPEVSVKVRIDHLTHLLGSGLKIDQIGGDDSERLWRAIAEVRPLERAPAPLWRLSVAARGAAEIVAALPDDSWFMDWAGGLIWCAADAPPTHLGRDGSARAWGGAAQTTLSTPPAAGALKLMAGLKAAFDPADILNRGRLAPAPLRF